MQQLSKIEIAHFVVICWGLWGARNRSVWEGRESWPREVVRLALAYLRDWREASGRGIYSSRGMSAVEERWQSPDPGMLKLNGYKLVLRGVDRQFVVAGVMGREGACLPWEAEALAIREALSWLKEHNFDSIQLETDAQQILLQLHSDNLAPYGLLLKEFCFLSLCFRT